MKKLLIAVFAILSLTQLNALTLEDVLQNKTLAKEIQDTLQKSVDAKKTPYTVAGLLYTGDAVLVQHNNSPRFSLTQNKGYVTYNLRADNQFDTYSLEVVEGERNFEQDPHRTNVYSIFLRLFKGEKLVLERMVGVMELDDAGLANTGSFYTNLAVNATFVGTRFYILDKEPNTCGKQIDLSTFGAPAPTYEVRTVTNHTPDCKDHYHCSCPTKVIIDRQESVPAKVSYTVQTEACKKDKTCKCPEYILLGN